MANGGSERQPKPGDPGTPGFTARTDQLAAGGKDVGRVWAAYWVGMKEAGMTEHAATQALCAYVLATTLKSSLENLFGGGGFPPKGGKGG